MNYLNKLATLYGSDMGTEIGAAHNYCEIYEDLFEDFRFETFSFLEIGVHGWVPGVCSLQAWEKYFVNAKIFGIDSEPLSISGRFVCFQGDQENFDFLKENFSTVNDLQVIIDDASHIAHKQWLSFTTLFPLLCSGGYYCIAGLRAAEALPMLVEIINYVNYGNFLTKNTLEESISSCEVFCKNNLTIFRKTNDT